MPRERRWDCAALDTGPDYDCCCSQARRRARRSPAGKTVHTRWLGLLPECEPESVSGIGNVWKARSARIACSSASRHCTWGTCPSNRCLEEGSWSSCNSGRPRHSAKAGEGGGRLRRWGGGGRMVWACLRVDGLWIRVLNPYSRVVCIYGRRPCVSRLLEFSCFSNGHPCGRRPLQVHACVVCRINRRSSAGIGKATWRVETRSPKYLCTTDYLEKLQKNVS